MKFISSGWQSVNRSHQLLWGQNLPRLLNSQTAFSCFSDATSKPPSEKSCLKEISPFLIKSTSNISTPSWYTTSVLSITKTPIIPEAILSEWFSIAVKTYEDLQATRHQYLQEKCCMCINSRQQDRMLWRVRKLLFAIMNVKERVFLSITTPVIPKLY